jgi:hypothetical protein
MNCNRAFEIDLEDLLADPGSAEFSEFEAHSTSCSDCAAELALQRGLLARLKGEEVVKVEHPADALLLRLARDPDKLHDAERASLRAHLGDCPPCDDAYRATLMLVPEPQPSPVARLAQALRGALVPSALPAWAPIAAGLVLAVGLTLRLDPLGLGDPAPEFRFRGVPSEFAMQVEVAPGERASLSLYGLAAADVVLLRLELPVELRGSDVAAKISLEGEAPIFSGTVSWDPNDESGGFLEVEAGDFERDSYVIELVPESGAPRKYVLDVR